MNRIAIIATCLGLAACSPAQEQKANVIFTQAAQDACKAQGLVNQAGQIAAAVGKPDVANSLSLTSQALGLGCVWSPAAAS